MSLSSETQRVQQGVKDTLKTLIQKLGGTVASERVDGYPSLANAISNKLLPDNLLSAATASSLGLSGAAVPNEAFAKLKSLVDTAQATADAIPYVKLKEIDVSEGVSSIEISVGPDSIDLSKYAYVSFEFRVPGPEGKSSVALVAQLTGSWSEGNLGAGRLHTSTGDVPVGSPDGVPRIDLLTDQNAIFVKTFTGDFDSGSSEPTYYNSGSSSDYPYTGVKTLTVTTSDGEKLQAGKIYVYGVKK